jgi:uncharacterized protein (DUF983 family)
MAVTPDPEILKLGWHCKCPKCKSGDLYKSRFSLDVQSACPVCGLDFSKNDSADGPAVFLIFILGFSVVPLALLVAVFVNWPLWLHTIIWGALLIVLTVGMLRPIKAYIIALQFKHRPRDWES